MSDFFKAHFDKLLLSALLLVLFFGALHVLHHNGDGSAVNWLENIVGQVLAALLTLMVGARTMQRSSDGNGNGHSNGNGAAPSLPAAPSAPAPSTAAKAFGR